MGLEPEGLPSPHPGSKRRIRIRRTRTPSGSHRRKQIGMICGMSEGFAGARLAQCGGQLEDDALVYERQRVDRELAVGEFLEAIDHLGDQKAQQWARGVKANLARDPKGGDTDQILSVAAGECQVAISNTYYYVRLASSKKPEDRAVAAKVGVIFPNQKSFGTHINVSGGGVMRHAPHRENALRFLEYLASPEAQAYFANGNNEWPAVPGVKLDNPALARLGTFKEDQLNVGKLGVNQPLAQKIFNTVGLR